MINTRKYINDIKTVATQLEEYATQCFKDVSDYFLQLHNFLQNEEHRILEDLHFQCMEPQQTIRDAFGRLGESQSILNKMRTELEQYQRGVPVDIHLRNVFDNYNAQLEQIECHVHISELTKSPFTFEVKHDMRKDFSQFFSLNYVDPKISLRFTPVYSDLNQTFGEVRSDTSDEMDVDRYTEKHKRKNNEKNKKKRQAQRQNDNEDDVSNNDNTSDTETQVPVLRDKGLVRISYVKSPEHFYVQTKNAIRQIRELSNKYVNFMQTDVIPKVIAEGQCYMTYHADDNQWYRAMVKKTLSQDLYKVFLVDFGLHVEMPKERFCEIDRKSLNVPFAAIRCAINDIMPAGKAWNEEANNLLIEITRNQFVRISIIERIKENILSVDLITTSGEETISVRDSFLYTGLARERSGEANMPPPLKKISPTARTSQRLPKHYFHNGDMLVVKVGYIENPHIFYVIKMDTIEAAQSLKTNLNFKYSDSTMTLQPIFVAPLQMCCAVHIEDIWHRARVEEIRGGGKILVHLVDEGSQQIVNWRQIYPLTNKFRSQKEFAIKCALADVEPLQNNNYAWTAEAIREFSQLSANPTLQMTILSSSQTTFRVSLHVCKKHMDINIGAMLAKYGHCISTGESSQVVEVLKTPKKRLNLPMNPLTDGLPVNMNFKDKDMTLQGNNPHTTDAVARSSNPVKVLKRTPVNVMHIADPGEFYINISSLTTGITKFHNQLQQAQSDEQSNASSFSLSSQNTKNWSVGERCLVYTKYKSDYAKNINISSSQREWYRAIIILIKTEVECQTYTVFLRDIGATIAGITGDQLRVIDHQWDRVTNAVYRCHLACVEPTGGMSTWSHSAIDYFKHTVISFESLSATMQGKRTPDSNSLPIVLWGTITETEDPLAPCISKHSIINRILVKAGLAHSVQRLDVTEQLDKLLQMELAEGEITMEEWNKNFSANAAIKEIDRCAQQPTNDFNKWKDTDNFVRADERHDGEHIPQLNFILDIEMNDEASSKPTVFTAKAPEAWLHSKPNDKSIFAAIPTYVDYEAIIYLHDANDEDLLNEMRAHFMKIYSEYQLPNAFVPTYTPGQGCLVRYHVDKRLYRGIIQELKKDDYIVQFIDYGNVESVKYQDLYPFAPYPKLPRIAHKYRIGGICAKADNGVYTTDVLDIIHVTIVEKLVSVRVAAAELQKPIKACSMRLSKMDVAEYLIEGGHVLRETAQGRRTIKPQHKKLKPFANMELTTDNDDDADGADKALPDIKADTIFQFKYTKHHHDHDEDIKVTDSSDSDNSIASFLDMLIDNLDDHVHLNSDECVNDDLMRDDRMPTMTTPAQAAHLTLQQEQTHQQTFVPPCKKRMFDTNEYKQMHKQMLHENLYGSEHFMKSELAAIQSDNVCSGGDMSAATVAGIWGIGDDDDDAAVVELEQSFALNYWHTVDDDTERQKAKEKEKHVEKEIKKELKKEKAKEQQQRTLEKPRGREIEIRDSASFALRPRQVFETSAFDKFFPNETSSVFSYFSGFECFRNPHLPVGKRTFECSVACVVTPTIVQLLPHLTEFKYRELELQRRIKHLVKTSPPLTDFEPRTICLAQYPKDKKWYRSVIRSHNPVAKQVDVLFVDYLNTESVAITHLKQCPLELINWPLRTIRASLHGLIPNPRLREKDIRQALQNVVLKRTVIGRIVKESKHLDNTTSDVNISKFAGSEEVGEMCAGSHQQDLDDILEVNLYNNDVDIQNKNYTLAYEALIQDSFYSYKNA
ncbi:uncharacterized protein LOC129237971 [Anastrepha obliqua]|uniref:uncharacterized protein LOC129237971 n=1 Tax=Anastrepha obliqua TaxID=95512 RepID=UPI0024090451|nr:uncharacterized protein LOC129237971 [Anastrepha obliqua]